MPSGQTFGDHRVDGDLSVGGTISAPNAGLTDTALASGAGVQRSKLAQESTKNYPLHFEAAQIWNNATADGLASSASGDDLGFIIGTFGTDPFEIQSSDAASATVTQYARWQYLLPPEYVAGQSVELHIRGKMQTVSDTTAVANWDVYVSDNDGTMTAVADDGNANINSGTVTSYTTVLTATNLDPGDLLDLRLKIDITDAATGSGVIWEMYEAFIQLDIKG